ncbi:hypothetical protein ABZ763_11005 [Streptomyces bacillaris]|uniref:hypothetical protein n=1 Tax=Streptomyces bacillaris TaxID=68179 RepID=UPI00345F5D58
MAARPRSSPSARWPPWSPRPGSPGSWCSAGETTGSRPPGRRPWTPSPPPTGPPTRKDRSCPAGRPWSTPRAVSPSTFPPKPAGWVSYVADDSDPDEKPIVGFSAPAILKEKWCLSDDDHNGTQEETALASVGSRGEREARNAEEAARENARLWVYGSYAQPHEDKVTTGPAEPFAARSGLTGSVATASSGLEAKGRCDFDGRATAFAFKDGKGQLVSWTFVGVRGVTDEVPDQTVRKILSTVRLVEATG